MYRYVIDNALTYTAEDIVLFRESPFACWMERLTLDNPDHGIPPDSGSVAPRDGALRQDDLADTLRAEGKDVCLIDWEANEPDRRSATLDAMRRGVDFIVNGQLALGPLSGTANLLMRTSGYSELGDFLYIPCDTQVAASLNSAFRLCFLADLLHSLQGQLPPQMLIIRGGADLVPLASESHIYHYRAVKQRFMDAMREFRKHRMPDPAESSHFGRWSDCAHEVLKQRLLREESLANGGYVEPRRKAVGAVDNGGETPYDRDDIRPPGEQVPPGPALASMSLAAADTGRAPQAGAQLSLTLAEQARMLKPGTFKAGPGEFRLGLPRAPGERREEPGPVSPHASAPHPASVPAAPAAQPPAQLAADPEQRRYNRRISDAALQNLEFIGSRGQIPDTDLDAAPGAQPSPAANTGPLPNLRNPPGRTSPWSNPAVAQWAPVPVSHRETAPGSAPDRQAERSAAPAVQAPSGRPEPDPRSSIDMDSTHVASPPPQLTTAVAAGQTCSRPFSDGIFSGRAMAGRGLDRSEFSDSLITSDDLDC